MDTTAVAVIAMLVAAVVILAIVFRRGSFKAAFNAPLGTSLDVEGRGLAGDAAGAGEDDPGKSAATVASGNIPQNAGNRAIQVGGDAGGTFVTGDG